MSCSVTRSGETLARNVRPLPMTYLSRDAAVAFRGATNLPRPVLCAYAQAAAEVFPQVMEPHRCVNASWIFVEVMKRLGLDRAKTISVRTIVVNAAYREMMTGKLTREEQWRWADRGAWAVVCDGIAPDGCRDDGWPGHVVGMMDGWLVDGASGQVTRPHRKMFWPEALLVPVRKSFLLGREVVAVMNSDGGVFQYRVDAGNVEYRKFPGFRPSSGNLKVAAEIERRIRTRISEPGVPERMMP